MSLNVELLTSTFAALAPHADVWAARFYEELFQRHPQLQPLFAGTDLEEQRRKLVQSLVIVVRSLERPEALERLLHDLGGRHVDYGATAADYPLVGSTLLDVLAEFAGPAIWTEEVAEAWTAAVGAVAQKMLEGAALKTAREPVLVGAASGADSYSSSSRFDSDVYSDIPATTPGLTVETPAPPQEIPKMTAATIPAVSPAAATGADIFYGMVESAPYPMFFVNGQGTVTYLNRAGQTLFRSLAGDLGFGPEQFVGGDVQRLFRLVPELQSAAFAQRESAPIRGQIGSQTIEFRVVPGSEAGGHRGGTLFTVENVTDLARAQAELARIQGMVDNMPINVLLANRDFELVYMNPSSERTLKRLEHLLPRPVDQLVGQKIDIFHKNPEMQRRLLSDPRNLPHKARIQLADEWLDLSVSAITDNAGKYVGPMVSWEIVTEKVKMEGEVARIQNMMDNLPINVMLANRDFELVYMNPCSVNTLKKIEHLLPRPVNQLMGQKIDIFHKQPEMQRKLLSDPRNLPHKARIQLSDEYLDLNVSAILDKDGSYVGPMVCWSVVTNQVKLADDFERDVKAVVEIVTSSATEMQASSKSMAAASEETARQSQVVAAASEEATRNVETVSSAAEELSKSIAEIARHVQEASKMTASAVSEADRTNVTIRQLGDSSNEIGHVVKVITSIAQQTNLLALNATIEAARAGEAGKGFAVVANEVKELARQTAKATEEISQKINAIQGATSTAVGAIGSIGENIRRINEISTTIASAVEEQTAATNEISRNVAEAARGTAEVSSNIAGVSQAADEGGRGASDILAAAEGLAQESTRLDTVTSDFLKRMRAL